MFKLWCEWDVGQDTIVFTTKEKARDWFNTNPDVLRAFKEDIIDYAPSSDMETPFEYYDVSGLVCLEKLEVI